MNPTRAEIDFKKLAFNVEQIKRHIHREYPRRRIKICGVVKANAYGHGIEEISKKLVDYGIDFLGVANYDEAIRLRRLIQSTPILVFGTLIHSKLEPAKYVSILHRHNLTATVASLDTAKFLNDYSRRFRSRFKVHIKIDTGMRRIGFDYKRAFRNILQIASLKNLELEGIFTHFAASEEKNKSFANLQLNRFNDLLHELKKKGLEFPIIHAANSGAVLDLKNSYFNMVRPGILLYGYYPSSSIRNKIQLKPIMNFKSKITYIKKVGPRESISYGRKYFTKSAVFIGSIPAGYGDGYWKLLSNKSKVLINKRFYPQVGAVTMDWIMVSLGPRYRVKIGDDVLLMGEENGYGIGADKLAKLTGTIPYEVLCAVADRVERVYLNA
ncbi:MAG: alanine racemase [Chlorobi bacterium]|nr:alanine racemase [Chlorobiota bacterium]MCI0715929.1 alanine racemase [Chlorobiota bacterium]